MHVHTSLMILDDKKNAYVEHTCACWLPMYGRKGKLDVDKSDPRALEIQTWEKP